MSKTSVLAKFHRADLVICSHSREGKTTSYSQINTVVWCVYGSYKMDDFFAKNDPRYVISLV